MPYASVQKCRNTVLCFSGLDPSGGAGLQADIESVLASGSHAAVVCTALTIQNSQKVYGFEAVSAALIAKQANVILQDMPVNAYKTGMLGSLDNLTTIGDLIRLNPHPYVLDPVMVANSGDQLGNETELRTGFLSLLPLATLVTPNTIELRSLAQEQNLAVAAKKLCDLGANAVLVKGGHEATENIRHQLYINGELAYESFWPRYVGEYHGTGCSLASFIAGKLAQDTPLIDAVQMAELWLSRAIQHADQPHSTGQRIPNRSLSI